MTNYKFWRNKTKYLIDDAKHSYYRNLIENDRVQKSSKIWKYLNDLTGHDGKEVPCIVNKAGDKVTDKIYIANLFNYQYTNISSKYYSEESAKLKDIRFSRQESFLSSKLPKDA